MRIIFAASPAIAVPSLLALARKHEIAGILTNPDSPRGRGKRLEPTDIARAAAETWGEAVPVLRPAKLDQAARAEIAALRPDLLVSFAYGKIFGPRFLALFPKGGINVHPSLLPRHRGSSPIQQAILSLDRETGVTVQRLALEMDCGDILAAERIPLGGRETAASLSALCSGIGAELVARVADAIESGTETAIPQEGPATYCAKISKEDGLVDWSLPCAEIDARIRAFDPWPGSYTWLRGQRLNILEAAPIPERDAARAADASPGASPDALPGPVPGTILSVDGSRGILVRAGQGILGLLRLQLAARKAMSFRDFANGVKDLEGAVLSRGDGEDGAPRRAADFIPKD